MTDRKRRVIFDKDNNGDMTLIEEVISDGDILVKRLKFSKHAGERLEQRYPVIRRTD